MLAIIGVLIGLLIPAVQVVREASLAAECANNLRQMGMACHACQDAHGRIPPAWNWFPRLTLDGGAGIGPVFFHLLPYIEQDTLYRSSRHHSTSPPQDYFDYGLAVTSRQIALYNCPLDPTLPGQGGAPEIAPFAASSYAANFLVFGQVDDNLAYVGPFGRPDLGRTFPDGTSHTILFGEKYAVVRGNGVNPGGCHWDYWGQNIYAPFFALYDPAWTDVNAVGPGKQPGDKRDSRFQVRPALDQANPSLAATGHRTGMNVCMADGSVRNLTSDIDRYVWWALVTPAGGE